MTDLTEHVVLPVADEDDARATGNALLPYRPGRVTVVHVIEKAGGAPDKAGVEQRQEYAEGVFTAAREALSALDAPVETEIRYGTDLAETIVEAAVEHDASAIAFSPRDGSRWVRLLTGDVALSLITEADRPVVVLPDEPAVPEGES